ncbi:MAG: glycosyltransferase family 2 protein, partial [Nonlabens sp.]|nr:glycosyltransferase family 2 protein [Nonlabens sp.]
WECIIVDDGSTDDTVAVVSAFAKANNKIHLYTRTDNYKPGGNGARQMGLEMAQGTHVLFLDSDDVLASHCIDTRINHVTPDMDMVVFHTGTFSKKLGDEKMLWNKLNEHDTLHENVLRFLNQDMPWHTTGVLWKKTFLLKIGGWNQDLKAWQDWELHVRALTQEPLLKLVPTMPDSFYRRDVAHSIASQKKTESYLQSVQMAIQTAELHVLSKYHDPKIISSMRYLIYRCLIAIPLKQGYYKQSRDIYVNSSGFMSVNKLQFYGSYLRERFMSITLVKRLLKNRINCTYYKKLFPASTFLKTKW